MAPDSSQPPLTLPPEQMRRLGYQVVDLVVDALAGLRDRPPARRAGPEELAGLLGEPLPRAGSDPEVVLRQAVTDVLGRGRGGAGHAALAAGAVRPPGDRRRAVRRRRLLLLGSDHEFRLRPDVVAEAVAADRAGGRRPFCVVATSGTTSTGSVDPLADLAALCRAEGLWFHVDGAFGAPAILTSEGRRLLAGIEQADSLALDAHKRLALVSFRFADDARTPEELEAVNRRIADAMLVDELATLSSTVLDGRTTLRLCTVNPRTTREDVEPPWPGSKSWPPPPELDRGAGADLRGQALTVDRRRRGAGGSTPSASARNRPV